MNWALSYINVHLMKIEYEPDEFDGGAITAGGDVTVQKKEDTVASITVIGGKDANDVELIKVIADPDSVFDPEGSRKVINMAGIRSDVEMKRFCESLYDAYVADLNAIQMSDYKDNEAQFKVGYYYQFTLDGVAYDEMLRRIDAKWDNISDCITWKFDFGKGKTFGRERLFNLGNRNDAAINELRLK